MKVFETLMIVMTAFLKGFFSIMIPVMSMCFSSLCGAISQSGSRYPSRTTKDGKADQRFKYTPNQAQSYRDRCGD